MPVAERVARVVVRLEDRDRRVRVQVVDPLHAAVVDVVEDVGERERRREDEDHVDGEDRREDPAGAHARGALQHDRIGEVHRHDRAAEEVLQRGVVPGQPRPQPAERTGHPARVVVGGRGRREHARPVRRHHDDEQAQADDRRQRDADGELPGAGALAGGSDRAAPGEATAARRGAVAQRDRARLGGHGLSEKCRGPAEAGPEQQSIRIALQMVVTFTAFGPLSPCSGS